MEEERTQVDVPAQEVAALECPFCGAFHARVLAFRELMFYVRCRNCLGAGPSGTTVNEAVRLWNTRPMVSLLRRACEPKDIQTHWIEEAYSSDNWSML